MHDKFDLSAWNGIMEPPTYQNLYLDTHIYHCFDENVLPLNFQQHLEYACNTSRPALLAAQAGHPTIVGEWALATTDCPQWANGFLTGSYWDGTISPGSPVYGNCTGNSATDIRQFTPDYRKFLRQFAEIQMDAYEAVDGWFFWTLKTETEVPQWDFLLGLREGWFPNPVGRRTYHC